MNLDYTPPPQQIGGVVMSARIGELAKALAQFQTTLAEAGPVTENKVVTVRHKSGGRHSFAYADLASILRVVLPLLGPANLSFSQAPAYKGGEVEVTTLLMHADSGQFVSSTLAIPAPPDAKEVGSAITYARRYALLAVLGVAVEGEDSDAPSMKRGDSRTVVDTNHPKLVAAFARHGIGPDALAAYLGHSLAEITAGEVVSLTKLGEKIRDGDLEAREEITGPSPETRLRQEMEGDGEPSA